MSELKNTLSGVFYLTAALAYLAYRDRSRTTAYAAALFLFVMALLTKSVSATLPAALLVVFWWQQGGLRWRQDVLPLVPFFGAGIAAGAMTAWMEHTYIGAQGGTFELTVAERVLIAGRAVWFYVSKLAWPMNLTFIYPRWRLDPSDWIQWLWPAVMVAFTFALWRIRTRSRAPLAAWLLFVGTLTPALGFINVYPFRYSFVADHFQYLASISLIAIASAGLRIALGRAGVYAHHVVRLSAVLIVGMLWLLTWRQSLEYVDGETLYRATLAKNPECWLCYNNLGVLKMTAAPADAVEYFTRSLELNPAAPEGHTNLAYAHLALGHIDEGAREAEQAVRLEPQSAEARVALGSALVRLNRIHDAAEEFRRAVDLKPASAEAHANYGNTLAAAGDLLEATIQLKMAVALKPDLAMAHVGLGEVYMLSGRRVEAAAAYREALRLEPDLASARAGLARAEGK
jgi:tetratricopeptide (TPR) repeat protein